jgi:phosphotransferase system enzyme I (PtsP)
MFANSKGWMRRMEEDIQRGLSAEAAVEKEQSSRARAWAGDGPICANGCDLDDLSNRLLRILTGQGKETGAEMPPDPILIARNIGPANCWNTGAPQGHRAGRGLGREPCRDRGARAGHSRWSCMPRGSPPRRSTATTSWSTAIRAWCICAPTRRWATPFRDKMAMQAEAQQRYASIRDKPATTL